MAVEFLRSCYSSEWQLFRNSTQRTKGRYYFCDDATPFYPGFHNLASRDWNDKNWPHDVRLGEVVDAKHAYYRGDAPTVPPLNRSVGNAECIQLGDRVSEGVPSVDLIDGFAPACMIDDAWARVSSYNQCATRRVYASLIVQLYAFDDESIHATIAGWLGDLLAPDEYTVKVRHHVGVMPGIITIVTPGWTVFVLDGTSNFQEIALQAFAFAQAPANFGIIGTVPLYYQAASYLLNALETDGMVAGNPVMSVGHSYGGAVALVTAARLRWPDPQRELKYLTFGSPKIGSESFVELVRTMKGWNLANDDDLITILPPDAREFLSLFPVLPWPAMTNWGFWHRPPNQVVMDLEGRLFTSQTRFLDMQTLLAIAEDAFEQQVIAPINGHRSGEYLRRIERLCPDAEWPIKKPTSKKIWLPEAVMTLTGKPKPSRDGALVFTYAPIPAPGETCLTALEMELGESFTWSKAMMPQAWFKCNIPGGVTSHVRQTSSSFGGNIIVYSGPDCGFLTALGFLDFGVPCLSVTPPLPTTLFVRFNFVPVPFTITFDAGACAP